LSVAVGIDTHKATLVAAAVDEVGRPLASQVFDNDPKGHRQAFEWIVGLGEERVVGIECSGSYGAALAWHLMGRGEDVREVPTARTYRERKRKTSDGKSDAVDALAIARVVARESELPVPKQAGLMVDLKLLTDHRDRLTRARTRLSNQVHKELVILRPGYQKTISSLRSKKHVRAALALIEGDTSIRAELTRLRLQERLRLDDEIYRFGKRIEALVLESGTSLTDLKGVGSFAAAKILGEVGDVSRIRSKAAFASLAGTAPLVASSGQRHRHRMNRGGNRQLNHALHVIAKSQSRVVPEVREYVGRKLKEGKSYKEALRCLQRRLTDVVYKTLLEDAKRLASMT
jgi:transposase